MSYDLFLDDERFPPETGQPWVIVRGVEEAVALVQKRGWPEHISFDNDLGHELPEGKEFAKWLVNHSYTVPPPENFSWYVHSQNPAARDYITSLLSSWWKHRS